LSAGVAAGLTAVGIAVALGGGEPDDAGGASGGASHGRRAGPELLSRHPLSARAAERRLEERFASQRGHDSASAHCSALEPRPAHAIRRCRIRFTRGDVWTVIVLSNPQGFELLVRRWRGP
jgi:hypothetical protein